MTTGLNHPREPRTIPACALAPPPAVPRPSTRVGGESGPVLGSLCTGAGGLDLGVLAMFGGRVAWVTDPDPHVARILAARMPGVPNLGDLRSVDWSVVEPVDMLAVGFPCQDISAAGKRAGIENGVRSGLWFHIMAGIRVLRPPLVVVENVAALRWRGGGLHRVLGDLAEAGYDAFWRSVRASDIGASHRRERVFVLAWRRDHRDGAADSGGGHSPGRRGLLDLVAAGRASTCAGEQRDGEPVCDGGAAAADPDRLGREELHPPHPDRRPHAVRPGAAAADTSSHGRDQGLPGPTRLQGRPDAALGDHPPHHPNRPGHLNPPSGSTAGTRGSVDWGVYGPAIRRWERILGRPTPHPTQPGNHGRPVLAPRFVEHLMGLPEGWVTDLPLPRTAQLRALGNGVVPHQAAHAVSLLLNDLAPLLHADPERGTPPHRATTSTGRRRTGPGVRAHTQLSRATGPPRQRPATRPASGGPTRDTTA